MGGWDNISGVPEPQRLVSCPLQLLEISFNCLEDVESTIPVSPLHLAVSPILFLLPSLLLPAPGLHKVYAPVNLSLPLPSCGDMASGQWSGEGMGKVQIRGLRDLRSSWGALLPRVSPWASRAEWGSVLSF